MASLFGRVPEEVWQDREIRFDAPPAQLQPRRGEEVLETLLVEDTKGNNGKDGDLVLTSLRLTWTCRKAARTNISIGYNTITAVTTRTANSRLKGSSTALHVLTKQHTQRFEFIFTALDGSAAALVAAVSGLVAAYEGSRPYRELRLRGAVLADKELKLLPREAAYSRISGVWNLSGEAGNLGTLYITNVRLVWCSNLSSSFNVSIPYCQVKSVRIADSKFGPALVVETSGAAGGYVLGFRVDPRDTLDYVAKEAGSLLQAYISSPTFGVEYDGTAAIDVAAQQRGQQQQQQLDEPDVLDDGSEQGDAWAAYYADGDGGGCADDGGGEPVFSAELGLAIEAPRDGLSVGQLWSLLL